MKIKINKYLYNLIKQNIIYIIVFLLSFFLLIIVLIIGIYKINNNNETINKLTAELNNLNKKYSLYNYDDDKKAVIEEDIKLLNMLIPNFEDYFSIIYALEKLSSETGFTIVDYTVNITNSNKNKLQLTVSGVGDSQSFLKFLDKYNFSGGRLITSDKIQFDINQNNVIKLNLTFYNKNINENNNIEPNNTNLNVDKLLEKIEPIKNKITFDFNNNANENKNDQFLKKSNPFQ